jgi:thiopeptide-type bacteriocin biosynthesis protein
MVRVPIGTAEDCVDLLESAKIGNLMEHFYSKNPILQEAVILASPELHTRILEQLKIVDVSKITEKVLAYGVRMSTRSTPFGLLSFVTHGHWASHTDSQFMLDEVRKHVRFDMEWLFYYIQSVVPELLSDSPICFRTNSLIFKKGNQYHLDYFRESKQKAPKGSRKSLLFGNLLVDKILEISQFGISLPDIMQALFDWMPTLDRDKAIGVIRLLVEQQYLLPVTDISLLDPESISVFCRQIISSELLENICHYQNIPPGQGSHFLVNLQKKLQDLVPVDHVLQVDMTCNKSIKLPKSIKKELEKVISVFWEVIALKPVHKGLDAYHSKFLERYGTHRIVPLLDLLDSEIGLGRLQERGEQFEHSESAVLSKRWEQWLGVEWQKCLREGRREILITEDVVASLASHPGSEFQTRVELPSSLDLYCRICADDSNKIDEGYFQICFLGMVWQGGSTLGRFLPLLNPEVTESLGAFFRDEEKNNPNELFVDVSFWPSDVRMANVSIRPRSRRVAMDMESVDGSQESLSLRDIYVGGNSERLYLTLKDGKADLIPCFGSRLNIIAAPEPIQFMYHVNFNRYQIPGVLPWGVLEKTAVFLPRVQFQKTILFPATWKLDGGSYRKQPLAIILEDFDKWGKVWGLPDKVILGVADQRMLLDLQYHGHRRKIATKLHKGETLCFTEFLEGAWLKSDKGTHYSELVIPVLRHTETSLTRNKIEFQDVLFKDRWKLPGGEWLMFKVYLTSESGNPFLLEHLHPWLAYLIECVGDFSWFLVRYGDPDWHFRVRIRLRSKDQLSGLLDNLERKVSEWMENGNISRLVVSGYEREIERYGGLSCIEHAETVFCLDTSAVCTLLLGIQANTVCVADIVAYTASLLFFLYQMDMVDVDQLAVLRPTYRKAPICPEYRDFKSQFVSLATVFLNKELTNSEIMLCLSEKAGFRAEAINQFLKSLNKHSPHRKHDIVNSLLHMHCNRLGLGQDLEYKVRDLASRVLILKRHLIPKN